MKKPVRPIALRYMTRFRCIGPDCEETCCQGWKITVDQGHYARLKRASASDPAERARFDRNMVLAAPADRDRAHFAVIRLDGEGMCPFLDREMNCSIHRRYGEELLPDTCAIYPRNVARVGDRLELTGVLSCPEVARLALLAEDATDLVEIEPELLGRGAERHDATTPRAAGFAQHLDEVRGAMYELMSRSEYPLRSRLYFTAFLADRTDPLFQQAPFDQRALERAIDELGRTSVLDMLHQALDQATPSLPGGLALVAKVLVMRMDTPVHRSFERLVTAVLDSYGTEANSGVISNPGANGEVTIDAQALAPAYARRRARVEGALGEAVERYCVNYCRHFWIKEWYVMSGSLRSHTVGLLARLALQRFLLLSHPAAQEAAARGDRAALDRLAVEVFYSFARSTGHNRLFSESITTRLVEQVPGLGQAAFLLAV